MEDGQSNKYSMKYTIIEVANTHGGDESYLNELILTFEKFSDGFGIKFQPLHPDKIAKSDFSAYDIYKKLFFSNKQWQSFISKASKSKGVWLDIFDEYGLEILQENIDKIYGIKLQVSVLFNNRIIDALANFDLAKIKLIINVAALEIDEIETILSKLESSLNPQELILEIGFQAYPTELADSGLVKINTLKNRFSKKIIFADHIDGKSETALWLPALSIACGADYIEKHVMLSNKETQYDHYSSLTPERFGLMVDKLQHIEKALAEPFINKREQNYLANTMFKPITKIKKSKGEGVSINNDFHFKRSNQLGLNILEIQELLNNFNILSTNVDEGKTLNKSNFKKATIAIIVAARLKSSRLKQKALLKIGNLTSIEKCLKNACAIENINHIILATSNLESDSALKDYTYSDQVIFHKGDPEDVIDRYLVIAEQLKIDVVIRATGDNPFIDNAIAQILLKSHFETGADFTTAKEAALGTNFEIFNTNSLKQIKTYFPEAKHSEYMTWYFVNNADVFKLNFVDLPSELVRNYRLTLDYDEDLSLYNVIDNELSNKSSDYTLADVFNFLDANPNIAGINAHIQAKYKVDDALINLLNKETKIKQ